MRDREGREGGLEGDPEVSNLYMELVRPSKLDEDELRADPLSLRILLESFEDMLPFKFRPLSLVNARKRLGLFCFISLFRKVWLPPEKRCADVLDDFGACV